MNNIIANTFKGYLHSDNHLEISNNEMYSYGLNILAEDQDQTTFISNEHGNKLVHKYGSAIVGKKYIAKLHATVVLLASSEIHLFDHNTDTSKFVAADREFNCNWNFSSCEWIHIYDYEEYICDTWITFSSNKIYYNINLSELLNEKRKQGLIDSLSTTCGTGCTKKTCDYFKVFKKVCDPHIDAIVLDGGSLRNGAYFISGRYSNNMSGYSNPFPLTPALHIGSEDNIAGEISNKKIEVTIQNFSCEFDQIELFIHEIIGGQSLTKKLSPTYINASSFTIQYTGNEGIVIDASELLINWRTYLEGEELLLHDNRAIYYRVTPEFDYNFQPIANQIEANWYAVQVPLTDIKKYNLTSFMRDETYAFSFSPNYKHGKKGFGFHVPAVTSSGNCDGSIGFKTTPDINLNNILSIDGTETLQSLGSKGTKLSDIKNIVLGSKNTPNTKESDTTSGSDDGDASGSVASTQGILLKRLRNVVDSSVDNPSEEKFIDLTKPILESWVGEIDDVCKAIEAGCGDIFGNALNEDGSINCNCGDAIDAMCERERRKQQAEICRQDHLKVEEIGATWFSTLSNYIGEKKIAAKSTNYKKSDPTKKEGVGKADILDNPVTLVSKLKDAAADILTAVKNKERTYTDYIPFTFSKSVEYYLPVVDIKQKYLNTQSPGTSLFGNSFKSIKGEAAPTFDDVISIEVQDGVYKNYPIVKRGKTKPKTELSKYPCSTDCNGNPIYCGLSGQNITHHTMPSNEEVPFWVPKSYGDGATIGTDADIMDGYGVLLGIEFTNINIPDNIKEKLCLSNPYNFGVVIRSNSTSSVILKGPASQGYVSSNQNKRYLYEKIGSNSFERCSKYIDINGSRMDPGATTDPNNIFLYSADQLLNKPYLNGTHVIKSGLMSGVGARQLLYEKGLESSDDRASRVDQRGSIHTINMSTFTPANTKVPLLSQIYTEPNAVISAPSGNNLPYMGKYNQESCWLSASGINSSIDDTSFVGDVLQYNVPVDDSRMEYFTLFKELDDQYGDISLLNYAPILQARGFQTTVRGLVGDSYIGLHTIIKTNFVSEKVGNYFPISNMVPGKADRCICDDPEDAIFSKTGQWHWKILPKEGDAADAKNWSGLHTTSITKTWQQAKSTGQTESDYYFPKVTKHAISFIGESNCNPWLRSRGDTLDEQVYDNMKNKYSKHSKVLTGGTWKDAYLNMFYVLHEQAAAAKLRLKSLIQGTINLILPALGIADVLSSTTPIEAAGGLLNFVINAALYILISQMLYTNEFVDRFLQLEPCKKDSDGGEESKIEKFFVNYSAYNPDYNINYAFPTIVGLPYNYTGCICADGIISNIYISDRNYVETYINGYQIIRPRHMINLQESHGKLSKIYELNNSLYLHTTNGVYYTRITDKIAQNIEDALLGDFSIAYEPRLMTTANEEGTYGLLHPNHGKLTKFGFIFVDSNAKDLILFNGREFDILSSLKYGNNKMFKKNLQFCSYNDCSNEQKQGSTYYTFGVDNRYSRLLFTKSDGDYSFTMSYSFMYNKWISFHSYIPQDYLYDRFDMYTIKDNSIYKHNNYDEYTTYYDQFEGCKIDFVSNLNDEDYIYSSTKVYTEAKVKDKREAKISFDKVQLSNSYQSTGELSLNLVDNVSTNANNLKETNRDHGKTIPYKMVGSVFNFNEIHNYIEGADYTIKYDPCKVEPILNDNTSLVDISKSSVKNRILYDNYLHYRFIFDNIVNKAVKLYMKRVNTLILRK